MALRITTLGRQNLIDGTNRGTRALQVTRLALGDGTGAEGAANDSRTALRSERDSVAASGAATQAGRLVLRGDFQSAHAYSVTELGVFARVGAVGAEFLLAYDVRPQAALAIAAKTKTLLVISVILELVQSAAELTVTLSPSIAVGGGSLAGLADFPAIVARQYLRGNAGGDGVEFGDLPEAGEGRAGIVRLATALQVTRGEAGVAVTAERLNERLTAALATGTSGLTTRLNTLDALHYFWRD
ncbi:MAG: hypothetical protein OXI69_15555 [Acidobacteriota bacterium]|nr:hypothetical protein [Acidobacteriota bacterium]